MMRIFIIIFTKIFILFPFLTSKVDCWCDWATDGIIAQPCGCESYGTIWCYGIGDQYNISELFVNITETLSERYNETETLANALHFNEFYLQDAKITELPENLFQEIRFSKISIKDAVNLRRIHSNAFGNSSSQTIDSLKISGQNRLKNEAPDYNLWHALSSLTNASEIYVESRETKIPSKAFAFGNGQQTNLKTLYLTGDIGEIEDYAFYYLNNVTQLGLGYNITHITSRAFQFNLESEQELYINMYVNRLRGDSFDSGCFTNANRSPLKIGLGWNVNVTYFDEKIFSPFLTRSTDNRLDVTKLNISCDDCRNFWLIKNKHVFEPQIYDPVCSKPTDGLPFFNLTVDNFKNCAAFI